MKYLSTGPMKSIFANRLKVSAVSLLGAAGMGIASGETLNWGSNFFDSLHDSYGNPLDESFYFQLGFFESLMPDETNTGSWIASWRVFDEAEFNPLTGYFTGTAQILADGSSTSPDANQTLGLNFSGNQAYVWARNTTDTEWFLATNTAWVFPSSADPCCDNSTPVEWAISDLDTAGDVPVWGRQGSKIGSGFYTVTDGYVLQTFTVVPEPSIMLLAPLAGLALLRRRRNS